MSMTVQQIIDEADELFLNSLTPESKVRKLNNIQKRLFRTMMKKATFTSYDIVADLAYYPIDFDISKVINVIVDGNEYDKEENTDKEAEEPYYYFYENSIVLYPTPKENVTAGLLIWHYEEPAELSDDDLDAVPDFDGDFHMILVYDLCKEMAKIALREDMVNVFNRDSQEWIEDFKKTLPEPELSPIGLG